MMKKMLLLSLMALLVLPLAGCGTTVDSAKADFCDDLGAFGQSLMGLREIGAGSTKGDLQDATKDAQKAWDNLKDSASKLEDVQVDGVQDAFSDLQKSIDDIPDDATLDEALADVKGAAVSTLGEILQIATTTCSYPQQ